MKPGFSDVDAVVTAMADLNISGFPKTPEGKSLLMRTIWSMVSSDEQLHWLLDVAAPKMRRFSFPELRGIFCSRFRPADGIEESAAETPGFRPEDLEQRAHDVEAAETQARLERWQHELKLLAQPEGPEPLALERVWQMPPRKPSMREISRADQKALVRDAEQTLQEHLAIAPKRTEEEKERMIRELEEKLRLSPKG